MFYSFLTDFFTDILIFTKKHESHRVYVPYMGLLRLAEALQASFDLNPAGLEQNVDCGTSCARTEIVIDLFLDS